MSAIILDRKDLKDEFKDADIMFMHISYFKCKIDPLIDEVIFIEDDGKIKKITSGKPFNLVESRTTDKYSHAREIGKIDISSISLDKDKLAILTYVPPEGFAPDASDITSIRELIEVSMKEKGAATIPMMITTGHFIVNSIPLEKWNKSVNFIIQTDGRDVNVDIEKTLIGFGLKNFATIDRDTYVSSDINEIKRKFESGDVHNVNLMSLCTKFTLALRNTVWMHATDGDEKAIIKSIRFLVDAIHVDFYTPQSDIHDQSTLLYDEFIKQYRMVKRDVKSKRHAFAGGK